MIDIYVCLPVSLYFVKGKNNEHSLLSSEHPSFAGDFSKYSVDYGNTLNNKKL